jgi:RNA polymerase sigma-70 factor (ECF subfamily)
MTPQTRASLIARISDADDAEAWQEFVEIYLPLLYRLARRKGLQHADAEELAQDVLLAVSRAVDRWNPDPARGRFRDWLFRIARNMILNYLTRAKHRRLGTGDSAIHQLLEQQPTPSDEQTSLFLLEYRREVFQQAARQVRLQVSDTVWQAFWLSSVEQLPIAAVALQLDITVGNVYIARSRVMARMREVTGRYANFDGSLLGETAQEIGR